MKEASINNSSSVKEDIKSTTSQSIKKKISNENKVKASRKKNSNHKSKSSQSKDSILDTILTIITLTYWMLILEYYGTLRKVLPRLIGRLGISTTKEETY